MAQAGARSITSNRRRLLSKKAIHRTAPTKRPKTSSVSDEVVAVGIELVRLRARHESLEGQDRSDVASGSVYRESEMEHISDRIDALREYISSAQAKTLQGAAVQIDVALVELDIAKDQAKEDPALVESQLRKIVRLLYSAGRVVDTHFARPAGLHPISDHLDPWIEYEQRLNLAGLRGPV